MNSRAGLWRGVLLICILVAFFSLVSLPSLYRDISGDSIPNRPQKGPPIEYQCSAAISRILIALVSIVLGVYSWNRINMT